MGDVTKLPGTESVSEYRDGSPVIKVEEVLQGAINADLDSVVVLGWDQDSMLFAASSSPKIGDVLLIMEYFKHKLLNGDYEVE